MADGLTITIEVTGDFINLKNRLLQKAVLATQAGAMHLQKEHEAMIEDWRPETKPQWVISDAIMEGDDAVYRLLYAHGAIWHYVNQGTTPTNIYMPRSALPRGRQFAHGGAMHFLWETGNYSYDSSYDPKTTGAGQGQHGQPFWAGKVEDRWIRPRHLDLKAIERARDDVIRTMKSFFD